MNDCSNAEIRDQLPDLLHERLDASARATVLAHVAMCADCRDELQLLRDVRRMFEQRAPRVDVAYVIGALPKAPARPNTRLAAPPRRRWADWRIAAAVTVLVAGGSSAALLEHGAPAAAVAPAVETPAAASSASVAMRVGTPNAGTPTAAARAGSAIAESASVPVSGQVAANPAASANDRPADAVGGGSRLTDLNESQLQTLLKDIDKLQAVPVTDPEPVMLRVNTQSSTEGEGEGA